jgi:hypothetical protein
MNIKELLLKGQNFIALLNQFRIDAQDFIIKDEALIFSNDETEKAEILNKSVCLEAKNSDGLINLYGILHYNLINNLAVFELKDSDKQMLPA